MGKYNQGYNNQNQGYSNNNNNQNKQKVKHSGAKHTTYFPDSGPNKGVEQHLTTGWRLSNKELISIKAVTTSKSNLSDKGWFGSIAVTFTNTKTGVQQFHWGTMQKSTGKVVVDSMAIVINPKAKNGGYAGTFLRSN
ncbi:hypothetical protein ACEN2I_02025 [Flavobacterium sp. W22_SRS_FK3]|uniref:hypothetical protein n=1 Tax=Flavobacterium sp. W22_SRS_FK3 TaxID=3240275 RepID=UPI003F9314FE